MSKYELCTDFTLKAEGGFTVDNGGPTNHGVTQDVYDSYRQIKELPKRSVKKISENEVMDLYKIFYYDKGHCEELSAPLSVAHFDWCVNHGVGGAIRALQKEAGVKSDGVWGPNTRNVIDKTDPIKLLASYIVSRHTWYEQDYNENHSMPINGWRNRIKNLWAYLWRLEHGCDS